MTFPDLFQLFCIKVDESFCGISDEKEMEAIRRIINDIVEWLSFPGNLKDTGVP
jgi:hypothetical protein